MPSANSAASIARWPSVAVSDGGAYIAGNVVVSFGDDTVRTNPLAVSTIGGRGIGRPAGTFRYFYPQVLTDARGRLQLVWAEAAGRSGTITGNRWLDMGQAGRPFTTLWTAVYDPARGWSPARKLFAGTELRWGALTRVEGDEPGDRGMIAFAADEAAGGRSITVVHLLQDSLATFTVPTFAFALYPTITRVGSEVLVGFIAAAEDGPPDRNSVFFRRSHDRGVTWEQEVLVSRSGRDAALELRVNATPDGRVHLVWRQTSTTAAQVIRHVVSADDGRTWSAPDDLSVPQRPSNLHTVVDACGTLHLLFNRIDLRSGASQLEYATWRGHWSSVEGLFPALGAWDFALHRAVDGSLRIGFTGRDIHATSAAPVTTYHASRSVRGVERP